MKSYYRIIQRSRYIFVFTTLLIVGSVISIILFGLNLGMDFTGGTLQEIEFKTKVEISQLKSEMNDLDLGNAQIQSSGDNGYLIRMQYISSEKHNEQIDRFHEKFGEFEEKRFETIGPTIGNELKQKSVWAVVIVIFVIIAYIAYTFRKVSGPISSWKYGVCAIIALVHDITITVGIFSLLGYYNHVEIDTLFITAILTILGYSVNDTIVVFDRIRENIFQQRDEAFPDLVNRSVNETIPRSLNVSITTSFVLFAIYIFGGDSIHYFILALMIGIIAGTYSSIFIASPMLVFWQKHSKVK